MEIILRRQIILWGFCLFLNLCNRRSNYIMVLFLFEIRCTSIWFIWDRNMVEKRNRGTKKGWDWRRIRDQKVGLVYGLISYCWMKYAREGCERRCSFARSCWRTVAGQWYAKLGEINLIKIKSENAPKVPHPSILHSLFSSFPILSRDLKPPLLRNLLANSLQGIFHNGRTSLDKTSGDNLLGPAIDNPVSPDSTYEHDTEDGEELFAVFFCELGVFVFFVEGGWSVLGGAAVAMRWWESLILC